MMPGPAQTSRPKAQQPSRKGKKAWRKNIDVAPVEEGLDEIRKEIIDSGAPLKTKESSDLFVVDSTGDVHHRLQYQRDERLKKPLTADQIINKRSAVSALDSRKRSSNYSDDPVQSITDITPAAGTSKRPRTKSSSTTTVSRSHLERLREIAYSGITGPKHEIGKSDIHDRAKANDLDDPWATTTTVAKTKGKTAVFALPVPVPLSLLLVKPPPVEDASAKGEKAKGGKPTVSTSEEDGAEETEDEEAKVESTAATIPPTTTAPKSQSAVLSAKTGSGLVTLDFLAPTAPARRPITLGSGPIKLSQSGKRIVAVPKPDPGRSYNPLYADWDSLISRMGDAEVTAELGRLESRRLMDEQAASAAASGMEADIKEREADLCNESEWEGFGSDDEDEENEPTDPIRQKLKRTKTKAERNKVNKRKNAERLLKHELQMAEHSRRAADVERLQLAVIESGVDVRARPGLEEQDVEVADEADDENLRRCRLGKTDVPGPKVDIMLEDELEESLRRLKPQGLPLFDRYRSLLVRGRVEARTRYQHKKPKRKATEKWTHKDFVVGA